MGNTRSSSMKKHLWRAASWLALLVASSPLAWAQCVGDCDASGGVTVDEVVTGVNIALGTRSLDECQAFDSDASQTVTVDELIQALNLALVGCSEPRATPTPTATRTPSGPTPTRTPVGPEITFFGIASASGTELAPIGTTPAGVPIYRPLSGTGFGFLIVIEAKSRPGSGDPGNVALRSDPFNPTVRPDLQIQSDRDLGNGSATICDVKGPPPNEDPGGGVPGIDPPSFSEGSQLVADAMNDFGCRFSHRLGNEPCTISPFGNPRFLRDDTQAQFCTDQVVGAYWRFPRGDTLLTVRWRGANGGLSPERKIILRVPE